MEYSKEKMEQFKDMLRSDVRSGDLDAGVAESYAGYFGLELTYTYTARITVTLDVTFDANPDADPEDLDSSDFDVDLTTSYCSNVSEINDLSVDAFEIEDVEEVK